MDNGFLDPVATAFLRRTSAREDAALERIAAQVDAQGLPRITPEAGRALQFLLSLNGAKRVFEIGTCLGYSTLWLARGLPKSGRLETVDLDAARAEAASKNVAAGKPPARVECLVGDAHVIMRDRAPATYDMVFIDAEKEGMPDYLEQGVRLLKKGGILAADNVFWHGTAFEATRLDPGAREVRAFVGAAMKHPDLDTTILPLGDGLLIARRT